jgi:aryl-alcohol dehydrogenase-like predicted oxidoreductase
MGVSMKQRQIGKAKVSEIGFGAMSIGGMFEPVAKDAAMATLDKVYELGITHIDTALIYGPHLSEELLGEWLRANPAAKKKLHIATKGGVRPSPREVNNEAAFLRECLEGSLKRLGVDCVDLYYVHRRQHSIPIEEVTETLAKFKKEGKIKALGFSEISPASLERASSVHHVAAVQNEYSLWTRLPELGMLEACERFGTTLVAFSPLGRGVFSDTPFDPGKLAEKDWRRGLPRMSAENWPLNAKRLAAFRRFAKNRGWTTEALALAWLLSRGDNIIPIPGSKSPEHMVRNVAASKIRLTKTDLAEINKILPAGWAHGNRYSVEQQGAAEQYC